MKPILFNTEMVRAILDNRKTATRRIIKPQPKTDITRIDKNGLGKSIDPIWTYPARAKWDSDVFLSAYDLGTFWKPPYRLGDILYVREDWQYMGSVSDDSRIADQYIYRAGWKGANPLAWRPSAQMPREAARIFLRVTNVRAERLHEITKSLLGLNDQIAREGFVCVYDFAESWNKTIKKKDLDKYGWDANPWVWAIEFEQIEKPE